MSAAELSSSLTFPIKLKTIVDSPETDYLIYWDEDGTSFHISDENQFARDVIPNYFKHSNISSFIRQLNMYGFHKVNRIDNGLAIIGTGNDNSQWVHPHFQRDRPELLTNIVRKVTTNAFTNSLIAKKPVSNNNSNEIVPYDSVKGDIARLAKMVQFLKKRDEETSEQLKSLQDENHELYSELMFLREQHEQQTKCIEMLIEFFSRCAKKPSTLPSRLRTKRNILALECPDTQTINPQRNQNEPPRKFFISKPHETGSTTTSTNDLFKGKKVIKISNFTQASHIDINAPKTINSFANTGLYHMPTLVNTQSQKTPVIYTLSLPKNATNNNVTNLNYSSKLPIRAITAANNNPPITIQKPTFSSTTNHTIIIPKVTPKTVLVTAINSAPDTNTDSQYFMSQSSPVNNFTTQNHSTLNQPITVTKVDDSTDRSQVSHIVSGLSSVEQCLNELNEMFDNDPTFDNLSPIDSNNAVFGDTNNCVDVDDDDWKMLLENIRSDSLNYEKDPGRIHGNELIPFIGCQSDGSEGRCVAGGQGDDVTGGGVDQRDTEDGTSHYQYSIDDLLQTPDIHPGMSSLSLDYMDDIDNYHGFTNEALTRNMWKGSV